MYKLVFASLFLILSANASAIGPSLGDECTLAWDAPTTGPVPRGYSVRWSDAPGGTPVTTFDAGDVLTVTCSGAGMDQPGQYYARVRSYNNIGESASSNEVPFMLAVPGVPGNLTVGP